MALFIKNLLLPCRMTILNYSTVKKAEPGILALGKSSSKKKAKFGGSIGKKLFDVETDANRLVNFVCGTNILKEGGEDIKIRPDSEYPDWLWTIPTGKAPRLEDMDPNSLQYWKKIRKLGRRRNNYLKSVKPF